MEKVGISSIETDIVKEIRLYNRKWNKGFFLCGIRAEISAYLSFTGRMDWPKLWSVMYDMTWVLWNWIEKDFIFEAG